MNTGITSPIILPRMTDIQIHVFLHAELRQSGAQGGVHTICLRLEEPFDV